MFGRISPNTIHHQNNTTARSGKKQNKNNNNNNNNQYYRYDDFILNDNQKINPTTFNLYNSKRNKASTHGAGGMLDSTAENDQQQQQQDPQNNNKNRAGGFLLPGPGSYEIPNPGWKRKVRGAVMMKPRDGPSERELILSNGVHVRNILPAPSSFTKAPPRTISPTLLQAADRRRAFQEKFGNERKRSPSPTALPTTNNQQQQQENVYSVRKCDIGLMTREMAARPNVGPGSYNLDGKFLKSNGAYSRGIVFSTSPRLPQFGIDTNNNNNNNNRKTSPSNNSRSTSPNNNNSRSDNNLSRTSSSRRTNINNNNNNVTNFSSTYTSPGYSNNNYNNNHQMKQQQQQQQQQGRYGMNTNIGGTFGHAPRILDMNVVNPFLRGPELAPPVGSYESGNTSPRGGNKKVLGIPSLYRKDREIRLERKTAAPGPAVYESARSTDIWKPVVY